MRRFKPSGGLLLLAVGTIISVVLVTAGLLASNYLLQTILLLASMGLLFYSSHPLAHYIVAKIYKVNVKYFFLSKSDFRKLRGNLGSLGNFLLTIGVKLDSAQLSNLSKVRRGFVFGAGAIVSNVLLAVEVIFAWLAGFNTIAMILATLFLLVNLGTELIFSTRVGDLAKMKKELRS